MTPAPRQPASDANGPALAWVPWLQAGVTALLVVLFVVIVGKTRQQNATIRQLQERVQGLENSASGDTLPPLPKLDEPAAPPPLPSPKPPAPAN
jgi:hypothetical protein